MKKGNPKCRLPRWGVEFKLNGDGEFFRLNPFPALCGGTAKVIALRKMQNFLIGVLNLEMKTPIEVELKCISNPRTLQKRKVPPVYKLRGRYRCVGSIISARRGRDLFVQK